MQKIKKLSQDQIQKIAAGEVVERPVNVIKELVENAVDAGATAISIYVEQAGQKKIQIIDNGIGMSPEDAQLCFEHHATSKLTTVEQLQSIDTFGFRGEALSSISAVSKVTLTTKTSDAQHGTQIKRTDKTTESTTATACNTGTTISVEDLFYNVPARKKFLKKPETELRLIGQLFQAFCFDYLAIHFKLFSDGKLLYNCPAAQSLQERATQVWQLTTAEKMLAVNTHNNGIALSGIISDHQVLRYDRNQIYFFVNKRWIKNYELAKGLLKGYMNVLPQGKFPAAVLNLTIDPHELDINIHPKKEEVAFLHPRRIENALTDAVKTTLEQHLSHHLDQTVSLKPEPQFMQPALHLRPKQQDTTLNNFDFDTPPFAAQTYTPKPQPIVQEMPNVSVQTQQRVAEFLAPTQEVHDYNIIGQYKKTYILLEHADGLFLIDQHAAHERILYQKFIDRFGSGQTINLLFACTITLTNDEIKTVLEYKELFTDHGITLEEFGTHQLRITSVPVYAKDIPLKSFITEIICWINEHKQLHKGEFFKLLHERMHAQMACKAAIKAGDSLSPEQMQQLIIDLYATQNRLTCPHGRPTGWLLAISDIEKKFKRKL